MVAKLAAAFEKACANPEYKAEASARELNPRCLGPDEFRSMLNDMYPLVESISKELLAK
jgi:tripartite-type tricarboxylate transporter receptor subunit TctC